MWLFARIGSAGESRALGSGWIDGVSISQAVA